MKKHIVVKQKHLYTEERNLMFEGQAFFSDSDGCLRLSYTERGSNTAVSVEAENEELRIQRDGELMTRLTFQHKKQTTGSILSEFGTIDIGVFTHKYIKRAIYWICIGICVVLLLMYEFFTHPWYYRKMEEKQ